MQFIKTLKKTIRWVIGIILSVYALTILLLNIPFIQQNLATLVSKELSNKLNTEVFIRKINIGLLNRIIIDDLLLEDQNSDELLKVTRFSAKLEILPLFNGKIRISSVQLFGFNINLNKATPDSETNFQFIIDAFASKDDTPKENNLDLRINTLLIRRGKLSYNVLSTDSAPGRFNKNHIEIQNIIANISLKALQKDSINIAVKRLNFDEQSGFELKKLNFKTIISNNGATVENFNLELPNTSLNLDTINVSYNGIESLEKLDENIAFEIQMLPSYITPKDISPFVPVLANFDEKIELDFEAQGTVGDFECKKLSITSGNNFKLSSNASFQHITNLREAFIYGKIGNLQVNKEGIDFIFRNFVSEEKKTPQILTNLGDISFHGEVSGYFTDLVTYGILNTDVGSIKTDVKLTSDLDRNRFSYSGLLETKGINIGQLTSDSQFGETVFNFNVDGKHEKDKKPDIQLKGFISSIEIKSYQYENITIDGEYKSGNINGEFILDDPNGQIHLQGSAILNARVPKYDFYASIKNLFPNRLNLTPKYEDTDFSINLEGNLVGKRIEDLLGEIKIDSFIFNAPNKKYFLDYLTVESTNNESVKSLIIDSDFLKASIIGSYNYQSIEQSLTNILHSYLPSLVGHKSKYKETNNNFKIDINVLNTQLLSNVLDIPIHLYSPATIKGFVNDQAQHLRFEGYFPRIRYKENFIESGMFLIANTESAIDGKIRLTSRKKDGAVNISLTTQAKNDIINTTLDWGNNTSITYSGKLDTSASFFRSEKTTNNLEAIIDINPTEIILNDTIWKVSPSQIKIAKDDININNFNFSHNERFIHIDGKISSLPTDTIKIDLNRINIGYVFDIAQVTDDVDFEGDATGYLYGSDLFKTPQLHTQLKINNFALNNGVLGQLDIYGTWNNENNGIYLDARIANKDKTESFVKGHIFPIKPTSGLDLMIDATNLNIKFIEKYMNSIAEDLKGSVSGKVHFYGPFKELALSGSAMTNASMKIDILNTTFVVNDSIRMHSGGIDFNKVKISDLEGHTGTVNGYLKYNYFKNIQYYLDVQVNNMLLMNTNETADIPFYGTVYATGNALLSGNAQSGLNANVAMTTNKNTEFNYSIATAAVATSTQFITFKDKTPRRSQDSIQITTYFDEIQKEESYQTTTDIRLNLLIDATPDATMKIIMDPATGDYISCKGTGNIRTEFYNKGDVKLFGSYRIQQGIYKFSLQEVIRKDFIITNGSTITFNGPPLDATLDIQAAYTVPSASLNDLIPDASSIVQQPNVRVNCIMNITGRLLQPTVKLDIALPNERDEIQTLVRNYISTEEQMNMQTLYLLGIGKFYMENNTGTSQSDMMSSVLSSTLSGQLNNLLSQIIDNNNWNIGTNLSTGEKGWTDMEVEGILSGQLLNNRLIINGNFGYKDNPMANTNFVGDFNAEWLLNTTGDIRLKAYNETNDRYYTKTNLTTQGVGIMFKKDFNRWNDLFFWKNWRRKKLEKKIKNEIEIIEEIEDSLQLEKSNYLPSYIQLKKDSIQNN